MPRFGGRSDEAPLGDIVFQAEHGWSSGSSSLWRASRFGSAYPTLEQLEGRVRKALNPNEAYNMAPGRDPENV